jgi:hypothetical protein
MYKFPIITSAFFLLYIFPPSIYATSMSNGQFTLEGGIAEEKLERKPIINEATPIPAEPTPASRVQQGYGIPTTEKDFGISLETIALDWDSLTPTDPSIRETTIHFFPGASPLYSLFTYENQELQEENGNIIPDTTCDDGRCDEKTASVWENHLTYGLGFRCDSEQLFCEKDFTQSNYYRQFTNAKRKELPATVLVGATRGSATIKTKVNIAGSQKEGVYENEIIFIAAPAF